MPTGRTLSQNRCSAQPLITGANDACNRLRLAKRVEMHRRCSMGKQVLRLKRAPMHPDLMNLSKLGGLGQLLDQLGGEIDMEGWGMVAKSRLLPIGLSPGMMGTVMPAFLQASTNR